MFNPNKKSTKPETFSTADTYKYYVTKLLTENPTYKGKRQGHITNGVILNEKNEEVISYKEFKRILSAINKRCGVKLIKGYTVNLGSTLGDLYIARIERNPNNLKVNFVESKRLKLKLKQEGIEPTVKNSTVYYTDDEYIRLKHFKPAFLRNLRFYHFRPAAGPKGYRTEMSRTIQAEPTLKAIYPVIRYNK